MSTYCMSDVHGCYEPYRKAMDYLKPDDKLYFLGDCCDRGDKGIKIFNELTSDPRVIFLLGNHEQMMMDAIPYIIKDLNETGYIDSYNYNIGLWFQNGGHKTVQAFYDMTINEIHDIRSKIKEMPTKVKYTSPAGHTVIMEHAGYSPFVIPHRTHDPVWDREHFYDEWSDGFDYKGLDPENTYLVHGHSPVQYLKFYYGYKGETPLTEKEFIAKRQFMQDLIMDGEEIIKPEVIRYCDNHKFDVDMCTIVSDRIALLNLDTFEVKYFDKE